METKIENAIDKFFENIAPGLFVLNIVVGMAFLVLSVVFMIKNKGKSNERFSKAGMVCCVVGLVAIISGFVQSFR